MQTRDEKMAQFIQNYLVENAPEGSDLKVGDTVYWTNEYGVDFENKIIGFNYDGWFQEKYKKFVHLDTGCYWFPHSVAELSKTKPEPKSLDLNLRNGLVAKFVGTDDFSNFLYTIDVNGHEHKVVLVDGLLHTIIGDFEEPGKPIKGEFQPLEDNDGK